MTQDSQATQTARGASKVVIVTGTGSPLGATTARHLAARGHRVVAVCSSLEAATHVHESIHSAGGTSFAFGGDVEDPTANAELVTRTLDAYGHIDAVVHTRVGRDTGAAFADTDDASWERLLSVSLTGTFRLVQEILPHFLSRSSGSIIAVASGGGAGFTHAVATGATRAFIAKLAQEYAGTGIRANTVSFGPLDLSVAAVPTGLPAVGVVDSDKPVSAAPVTPLEAAQAIELLISDGAQSISGSTLFVDNATVPRW
ncbi:MAG: SDR family oxidoreductase [Gordonia sp. (in: high G+C Gram-positive bacteria)]